MLLKTQHPAPPAGHKYLTTSTRAGLHMGGAIATKHPRSLKELELPPDWQAQSEVDTKTLLGYWD